MKLLVGLTGGIGSGKSTVSDLFKKLGAFVVDSDQISRDITKSGAQGYTELVKKFGQEILDDNHELNRKKLSSIVFNNTNKLRILNSILHPIIAEETRKKINDLPDKSIVVQDTPLLFETNMQSKFNLVISVVSDMDKRIERLQSSRKMSKEEIVSRISNQLTDDFRINNSQIVIDNSGSFDDLKFEVDKIWKNTLIPYLDNINKIDF